MSDPQQRAVRVRRSPRIGVFLILGAAAGAVVALVFIAISPVDPEFPTPQSLGFLVLLLAPIGALLGGAVAVLLDRQGERRARIVEAEHTVAAPAVPDPQEAAGAEPAATDDEPAEAATEPRAAPASAAPPADRED